MRRSSRSRAVLIGVAILLIAGAALAYFFSQNECSDFFPCHDSKQLMSMEERELRRLVQEVFEMERAGPQTYSTWQQLPQVLHVHVSGDTAALTVDRAIYPGALGYAEAWYRVYHRHHRGTKTVYVHVAWPSGKLTQKFPLSEF